MATSRRVARVSEMIKREVSQMLSSDIKDERVGAGMVSVTNVNVSGDLQHAKIYVSIYGTEEAKLETMQGLRSATGYVRRELGHRVRLRRTPEVLFVEDRGIEEGSRVISLIDQLSRERKTLDDDVDGVERVDSTDADDWDDDVVSATDDEADKFS